MLAAIVTGLRHVAHNEPMVEGALRELAARIGLEPHRADLHMNNRLVAIPALVRTGSLRG